MPSTDPSFVADSLRALSYSEFEKILMAQGWLSGTSNEATPGTPSPDYEEMEARWKLITDLRGSTPRMRQMSTTWLPQEEHESTKKYEVRLSRAFLYEGYGEGVDRLASRPFARKIRLHGEMPPALKGLERDVDKTQRSLSDMGYELLKTALDYGMAHIFIDFSKVPENATLQDEHDLGARALFNLVHPTDLISVKTKKETDGRLSLAEIRIKEKTTVAEGTWGQESVNQIRVVTPTEWKLYREVKDRDGKLRWVFEDKGVMSLGRIPLVTLYTRRVGFMMARPTMEALAWMNLAHYQSNAEQRNLLRFARIGLLFGSGFSEEQIKAGIDLSSSTFVGTTDTKGNLKYVEHQGNAMKIGQEDLESLERKMDVLSLRPFVSGGAAGGGVSATGQAIEEAKAQSALQHWTRGTELTIEQAYELAAEWHKVKLPEDFKVDIFNDFQITPRVRDDILALLEARALGEITRETLLSEFQRRGLLVDHIDTDKEAEAAKKEGPPEGKMRGPGNPNGSQGPGTSSRDEEPGKSITNDPTRGSRSGDATDGKGGMPR